MSKENLAPVWARAFDIDVDYAEGIYIHDTQGQRYMDFTSGIGVTNTATPTRGWSRRSRIRQPR
jgi:4-aminobutyrate aminotransferase-like enzyme